ncbi:MAG: T9SS type A sorting domain-containing protein [Bacteroidetes bacterium]|nr:T9SS type A sorting domain-containing protein [Bacteroidota bacterium]MBL6962961.1 T9SS type A sorting domain-containing protein [Bacteroidota bacterium]
MKKLYIFILLFIFISANFQANAQKRGGAILSAKYDSIKVIGLQSDFELISHNLIYNNTPLTTTYVWVVKSVDMPTIWTMGICDKNNCYFGADSQEFTLNGLDSSLFDIHFYPENHAGTGCVKVYVYPKGDYSEGIYLTGCCEAGTSSIFSKSSLDFNMYPSPVRNNLNIQFSRKGTHVVEVYNILGRRLIRKEVHNADRMRISFESLQNGMYVVLYRNEKGKVITKTISKE